MKTALLFLFLMLPSLSFAQTVNNVPLKNIDAEYLEFYYFRKVFKGPKYYLYINYGQEFSMEVFNRPEELKVKDEIGNELIFNSEIDCLNFMVKNGYELISKNERISGESSFPVFLMRKTKLEKKN